MLVCCEVILILCCILQSCRASWGNIIELDLRSTHNGGLFYTPMQVGRGANERTFNMLISTSYHLTWLPSIAISPTRGYQNTSSSDEYDPERYYSGLTATLYGGDAFYVHYDRWKVNSRLVIDRQAFGLKYPPRHYRGMEENIDGMLGLNDGSSEPDNVNYLFENLYKSNHIMEFMFSLYINNTAVANRLDNSGDLESQEGALVLGGIHEKYYTGDFKYVRLQDDGAWLTYSNKSIFILNIRLDWSRTGDDEDKLMNDTISRLGGVNLDMKPTRLKLDSSLILFMGEKKTLDTIHIDILGAKSIIRNTFYAFKDCRLDNKPDIVFELMDGFDVTLTPEDYVIEHQLSNQQACLSAFKPVRDEIWLFGTKFMRKYYTVFDYENGVVGFATPT